MDNMNIESELRFFISHQELKHLQIKLRPFNNRGRFHEVTIMYDNPNPIHTFYSPEIDGRLRLRVATPSDDKSIGEYGLVSWKQRIPESKNELVRHEKEVEFDFNPSQLPYVQAIFENILNCPRISSYERYRSHYEANKIHITLDEFPFGLMLELELNKSISKTDETDILNTMLFELGISMKSASLYSCDDMYRELCRKKGVTPKSDILFSDKDMPILL